MAYFAKKIKYCANEYSFVALLIIARKKGGEPIKFILYRYNMNGLAEMIEFNANEKEKAIRSFPYGPIVFEEPDKEFEDGTEFLPKRRKNLWQKTTGWLYKVGVGGWYQVYPGEIWVKVGRQSLRERKKLRLRFGELGHLFLVEKLRLKNAEKKKSDLEIKLENLLYDHDNKGEIIDADLTPGQKEKTGKLEKEIDALKKDISNIESKISSLKEEMRFKRKITRGQ